MFCLLVAGCGGNNAPGLFDFLQVKDFEENTVEVTHPGGPIPAPEIPPDLAQEAEILQKQAADEKDGQGLKYRVVLNFTDEKRQSKPLFSTSIKPVDEAVGKVMEKASDTIAVIVPQNVSGFLDQSVPGRMSRTFMQASLLEKLSHNPPGDEAGLKQRMRSDLKTAQDVLHSFGFYEGSASGQIIQASTGKDDNKDTLLHTAVAGLEEWTASVSGAQLYIVEIDFTLGPRYVVGHSPITLQDADPDAALAQHDAASKNHLPSTLADVGLPAGAPAEADAVLAAVGKVSAAFQNKGFPFAKVKDSRYFIDKGSRALEAEVELESGPPAIMGELEIDGESIVTAHYLLSMQTWEQGRIWNQAKIDEYRELLRQTGLFAGVEVYASEKLNALGQRNIMARLTPAPARTVGGAMRYDTDLGFGVLGYWEHRNLSGRGDKLRFEVPIWQSLQEAAANYRLPAFLRADQDLLISAGFLHEDNDSYKILTSSGAIGVERRLGKHWTGTARVRAEGGKLQESEQPERGYVMLGLPLSLTFNDTNRPLDASKGMRITLSPGPYTGYYDDYFTAIRTRLDAHFFWQVMQKDRLVMAFRGSYGTLLMADAPDVPPYIRFYSGGGGSVRGYDYRSIGPLDDDGDPIGGESLVELSVESRIKFNDEWGIVFFVDGGMVYNRDYPDMGQSLQWGGGAGLRYYTVLGPIRFDIATPLNPRDDDSPVQLYLSIGQSF